MACEQVHQRALALLAPPSPTFSRPYHTSEPLVGQNCKEILCAMVLSSLKKQLTFFNATTGRKTSYLWWNALLATLSSLQALNLKTTWPQLPKFDSFFGDQSVNSYLKLNQPRKPLNVCLLKKKNIKQVKKRKGLSRMEKIKHGLQTKNLLGILLRFLKLDGPAFPFSCLHG